MSGLFQAWHSKFLHYFFSVTQHMLLLGDGYHCANFFGSLEHKLVLSSHFVHVALGDAFFLAKIIFICYKNKIWA